MAAAWAGTLPVMHASPWTARVGETVGWWVLLSALWVATAPSTGGAELAAGVVAGLACALAAPAARHAVGARWRLRARWLRRLPRVAARIPVEAALVLAMPWRPDRTAVHEVALGPEPDPATAAGRRALAVLGLSVAPGSVVLDVRPGPGSADRIVLHRVPGHRASGGRAGS